MVAQLLLLDCRNCLYGFDRGRLVNENDLNRAASTYASQAGQWLKAL
jgi:hypothetical protein